MPHQEAVTVLVKVRDGQVPPLKNMLGSIREHGGNWNIVPFAKLPRVHFARFVVFDASQDLKGNPLPAQLALLSHVDAPLGKHLDELSTLCGEGMDAVFSHCEDYPAASDRSPRTRYKFLRDHLVKSAVVHVNRQGRTVEQIRQEDFLRRELNRYLDSEDFSRQTPTAIKERIVAFVRGRADLSWALRPPPGPALSWRIKEFIHRAFFILLAIVFAPLLLLGLPLFLLLLRYHEKRDVPNSSTASAESVRAFRDDEDYWPQNQIIAVGLFKPGLFRKITSRAILGIGDYATRHIYNRGVLSGLNTIHFARWVIFDDGRRLFFSSNYDGSLESYMNDFIDKAAWGLNAIFSNGDGFPTTAYLFCRGITDEKAYKRFLPTRQVQSSVWYSAYPSLTTKNIANNEAIRRGLSEKMNEQQTRLWLKRFGSGSQLPESGWAARFLDGLNWEKICRNCR
ncbi:MAG TPA: hypothetical protein VHM64_22375 [Candidatus Binatia bacterium]|nr:hypothetical protein [Candidatus Binatia bacterium]